MKHFAFMSRDMNDGRWIDFEDCDEFGLLRTYEHLKDVKDKKIMVYLAFVMPVGDDPVAPFVLSVGDILLGKPLEEVDLQDDRFRVKEVYGKNYIVFFDNEEFCTFSRADGVQFAPNYDVENGRVDIFKNMRHQIRSKWAKLTFSKKKASETNNDEYMNIKDLAYKSFTVNIGKPFGKVHLFCYNDAYQSEGETILQRANGNSLVKLIGNSDVCRWLVDGNNFYVEVDVFADEVYNQLPDFFNRIKDWPVYDDDEFYKLEREDLEKDYDDWIKFDLIRVLQEYIDKEFSDAEGYIDAYDVLPHDWAWQVESYDQYGCGPRNSEEWAWLLNRAEQVYPLFKDWVIRHVKPEECEIKEQMDASKKRMNQLL